MDFNDWRTEYPDGTRILWHEMLRTEEWLPGTIVGARELDGEMLLQFRLDSDDPDCKKGRLLSVENRHLLKKYENTV